MRSSHGEVRGARASDTGWGWIQIDSVHDRRRRADRQAAAAGDAGTDETRRRAAARRSRSQPGATIEVAFKFTAQLPEVFARTGYKGDFHMVGQWFPKIGVRVGPPGRRALGVPAVPRQHRVLRRLRHLRRRADRAEHVHRRGDRRARPTRSTPADGMRTLTYHAEDVHDFAWMADPYMEVMSGQAKRRRRHRRGPRLLPPRAARLRAPPPRGRDRRDREVQRDVRAVSVVDHVGDRSAGRRRGRRRRHGVPDAGHHRRRLGVRAPGMRIPEYVTVHEVGHNWFQGMLASNEAEEAWLDEGVNEWADAQVMAELYGPRDVGDRLDGLAGRDRRAARARSRRSGDAAVADRDRGVRVRRQRGLRRGDLRRRRCARSQTLEHTVGSQRFAAAMKTYAQGVGVQAPDRARPVRDARRSELGQDLTLVLRAGVPRGRRARARGAPRRRAGRRTRRAACSATAARKKTVTETEAPDTGTWVCEVVVQNTGASTCRSTSSSGSPTARRSACSWDDRGTGQLGALRGRAQLAARRGLARSRGQDRARLADRRTTTGSTAMARRRCAPARGSARRRRP